MTEDKLAIQGGEPVRRRPWSPWPEYGETEQAALSRVLASRSWGGFPSPNTEARLFAERFARYVGSDYAVPCANGTVSLTLALQAARVPPGAEVIVPAYTFVATAAAVAAAGCIPVLVDVSADSYCIDIDAVRAAIGPRTEGVIPVHLGCTMADMDELEPLCADRNLLLLEDCAHAHGARWRDRGAGSIGHMGSFSMQSSKLLTAGEGGAVTTSDDLLRQRLSSLVNCGRKEEGYDGFEEQMMGHNLRMTEWQAAILSEQLERLPRQHERRAARTAQLAAALDTIPGLSPPPEEPRVTVRTAYQTILRYDAAGFGGLPRDRAIEALHAEGVPCSGRFYVPLNEDPLFAPDPLTNPAIRAGASYQDDRFPVARRAAYEEAIWLPHELFLGSVDDVDDIVAAFAKLQRGAASWQAAAP